MHEVYDDMMDTMNVLVQYHDIFIEKVIVLF